MSNPYERCSQHGLMWILIVVAGIGCGLALGSTLPQGVAWGWFLVAITLPMLAAIALCVWLTVQFKRRRFRKIQAEVENAGFLMDTRPDAARKDAVFAPLAELQRRLELRNGAAGIEWLALRTGAPVSMCLFEHLHVTGAGKTTQTHYYTVAAWLLPHPLTTGVSGYRAHWLQRRSLASYRNTVRLGVEAFDKQWVVVGDERGAQTFFNAAMRALLADSPRGESWHTGPGWVACAFDGALDAHNLAVFRTRCEEILANSGVLARLRGT